MSKLMRVSDTTMATVSELSDLTGESKQDIIELAVIKYKREQFFNRANAAYEALRKDPEKWQKMIAEREEWDITLNDGLDNHD